MQQSILPQATCHDFHQSLSSIFVRGMTICRWCTLVSATFKCDARKLKCQHEHKAHLNFTRAIVLHVFCHMTKCKIFEIFKNLKHGKSQNGRTEHPFMINVTWLRFDQSMKHVIVDYTFACYVKWWTSSVVMVALCNRADHYIFMLWFVLSLWSPYVIGQTIYIFILFLSFFSSPNLSSRRLDVYHTSAHGVVLV